MADEPAALPSLEHGIAPPEELLPPTPWWVWSIIGGAIILVLLGIFWIRKGIQPPVGEKAPPLPDYYCIAKKRLGLLEEKFSDHPLSEIAAEASLAVRGFLAGALAEPALYETTEEFSQRDVHLPKDAEDLLNDLNTTKYSPSLASPELAEELVNRCQACLKTLHTANTLGK